MSDVSPSNRLGEIARVFLRLGVIGFGGPAVTIAMMEDETVTRRQWLDRDRFLDLVGLTNIIPGPNAAELAIHLGHVRGGLAGLFVAGAAFILPGVLCSLLLGWFYVQYGALPAVAPLLQGVKPAVLAALIVAVGRLGRRAIKGWRLALLGLAVAAVSLLGVGEVISLFAGGFLGMAWLLLARRRQAPPKAPPDAPSSPQPPDGSPQRRRAWLLPLGPGLALGSWAAAAAPLWQLGLFFLKVGAVLYGTGYVLIAFLEGGLVRDFGWLTQQQLLDAIAAGQLTPGPLLSTATFVGYVLRGYPGAAVATLGVFTPSFLIVFILTLAVPRIRRSPALAAFLDAINVCSIALMVAVGVRLAIASVQSWPAAAIAALSAAVALRWKVNSAWLVLGGALAGGLLHLLGLW